MALSEITTKDIKNGLEGEPWNFFQMGASSGGNSSSRGKGNSSSRKKNKKKGNKLIRH